MIPNPTPITAHPFAGMWIQNLHIMLPFGKQPKGVLRARLLPYDGESNLLAIGAKDVMRPIPSADALLTAMISNIVAEVKRRAKTDREVRMIMVNANDPAKPVSCNVMFVEGAPYDIKDCFALAATDATFAGVLQGTMTEVARLAGLV